MNDLILPATCEGPLTLVEIEAGIETIQATAIRLLRDARLLFIARRYASSATLAAMAITEIARVPALLELATTRGEAKLEAAWRRFRGRQHPFPWSLVEPVKGPGAEADINNLVKLLDTAGSRAECIVPGIWLSGDRLIRRGLAEQLLATAEMVCRRKLNMRVIEIWIDVVNSHPRKGTPDALAKAFANALNTAGLANIDLLADPEADDE